MIERIEEMRLTAADEAAMAELLNACFDTDFGGRSFFQQRHHVRLIQRDGSRIVGHMALSLRAIRMGETLVTVAGLAEVATAPDRRGEGIASRLMQAAIAEARASVAEFFVLFGDQPLYAASGFVPQGNRLRMVSMLGARTGATLEEMKEGLMVLPLGSRAWDGEALIDLVGFPF